MTWIGILTLELCSCVTLVSNSQATSIGSKVAVSSAELWDMKLYVWAPVFREVCYDVGHR